MSQIKISPASLDQVRIQMKNIDEISQDSLELSLGGTLPIPTHIIDVKARLFNWIAGASELETYSPYETIMQENAELRLENRRLATIAVNLEKRMNILERKLPGENVIVLREITRDAAKAEIASLFSEGRTLYYSDIATELQLDLELVVDICNELMSEGEISVADST